MAQVNLRDVQQKLCDRLKPSGWYPVLKMFLLSEEFHKILQTLHTESTEGRRFTPVLKQVFRAFEECPYDQLKVVVVGQDPYPKAGVADGISFSCSNTMKVQPSLRFIFKEVERTVYPDGMTWDPDLKRWANQGVLMLNTALTCEVNNIGSHVDIWKPFTNFLFDILNSRHTGLVYVFLGKVSAQWVKHIDPGLNYKMITTHPASAAYRKGSVWDTNDVFNKVNNILKENNNMYIEW